MSHDASTPLGKVLFVDRESLTEQNACGSSCVTDFDVEVVSNYSSAWHWVESNAPHSGSIIVVNLGVSGEEPYALIAGALERHPGLGVITISSREQVDRRIRALGHGAHLFLVAPFEGRELHAAARALRRQLVSRAVARPQSWAVEADGLILVAPNGARIEMSIQEARLVDILGRARGRPVSRLKIAESLGGVHRFSGNALEALISRFRRKVAGAYSGGKFIRAVNGLGYALVSGQFGLIESHGVLAQDNEKAIKYAAKIPEGIDRGIPPAIQRGQR